MIRKPAACVLGGLLLALAFPNTGLFFLAWIAFIPLFFVLQSEVRAPHAALYGAIFQLSFSVVDISWILRTLVVHGHLHWASGFLMYVGMVMVLSLFGAAFGLFVAFGLRRGWSVSIVAPLSWTALEYARTYFFYGFPWDLVGYSQAPWLTMLQISDLTGIYGVSFLIVLVNASVWEILHARLTRKPFQVSVVTFCAILFIASLFYGHLRMHSVTQHQTDGSMYRIGILQGNIPQEIKWEAAAREHTFETYEKLAMEAAAKGAQIVIWPETSVPVVVGMRETEWRRISMISEKIEMPMLVGAPSYKDHDGETNYFNSAFLVDGGMLRSRYDKIHLVPFAEYLPLDWLMPFGRGLASREADYTHGKTMTVMKTEGGPPFSVLICYEAIFPALSRLALHNGAGVLVNIVNDGWFEHTAAPYQHLNMAGVRSIENRVFVVRAANTGISAVFDPVGRLVGAIPWNTRGVLVADLPEKSTTGSFYSRFGDVFAWTCVIMCICLIVLPKRR
ncbi:MAG: apolipoprotein N-acyltransferase [Thermodesulfobacteriota bacterium]|nr:apolipoprotein N-acyltransferase [Thermodesulfobacteriota bacterium]